LSIVKTIPHTTTHTKLKREHEIKYVIEHLNINMHAETSLPK